MTVEKYLVVKKSTVPKAGKGLFTKIFIPKGCTIVEYKGKITSWKDADHYGGKNLYLFYVNKDCVIDARKRKGSLARYANDARGLTKVKGVNNNSEYITENKRIFIKATRNIPAGAEIFVAYGKEYWDVMKKI